MFTLIIVLALGVAAFGCWLRRRFPNLGLLMVMIGILGCAASLFYQVRETLLTPAPKGPLRANAVVAYYLANQFLREPGNEQGTILLLFPPENAMDEDTVATYVDTFGRVLRGFPDFKIEVVRLKVPKKTAKLGRIPLEAFKEATSNAPPAIACVSFAGLPAEVEKVLPGNQRLGFFAFDPWGTTNWIPALKKGLARVVIVPRPGIRPEVAAEAAGEPHEVFNQLYLLATPGSVDRIAEQLRTR